MYRSNDTFDVSSYKALYGTDKKACCYTASFECHTFLLYIDKLLSRFLDFLFGADVQVIFLYNDKNKQSCFR